MPETVVVRSRSRVVTHVALTAGVVLVAIATATSTDQTTVVVVTALLAATASGAIALAARQRTVVSSSGIEIHTFARVRRLSWDDVARFEVRTAGNDVTFEKAFVILRQGQSFPIAGTDRAFEMVRRGQGDRARHVVDLLSSYAASRST